MGGDSEEGASQLPDARLVKVLQILRRQDQGRLLFADALEAVADISHRRGVGEPEIQLVDGRYRVPRSEKLVGHIGENIEQQGIPQVLGHIIQALDAEDQEPAGGDIRVPIEESGVRSLAHGVEAQE